MSETTEPAGLIVTHHEEGAVAIPVTLDHLALAKQRRAARLADAKAYEALGLKLLRINARKLGEVGDYIVSKLGVKKVGHGTIAAAAGNAGEYMDKCAAIAQELLARDPPVDPEVIAAFMALVRDFNKQQLEAGEAHIRAEKQASVPSEDGKLSVPFPPGTPLMIGVSPTPRTLTVTAPPIEPPPAAQ